jgi:hypothetical protein
MNPPCTLGVCLAKNGQSTQGGIGPSSQTVGFLFWKDIFVDESAMYIGCIPDKKMFNPPKVLLDWAIKYLGLV